MLKFSHFVLIGISGLVWSIIGVLLMTLGVHHLMDAFRFWDIAVVSDQFSLFKLLFPLFKRPDQSLTAVISLCIFVGYLKGQWVLSKSVKTGVKRILSYPNPAELQKLYSKKYYLLIFFMMGLGMFLRWLKLPHDVHGAIDLAIGSALLKGALIYFRYAWAEKRGALAQLK